MIKLVSHDFIETIPGTPPNYALWSLTEIAKRSVYGKDAVYPYFPENAESPYFKDLIMGARTSRFYSLEDLAILLGDMILLSPQFTPLRLRKMTEVLREPVYTDVEIETYVGGFKTRLPVIVGAMGSTGVANRRGLTLSEGAAKAGIIQIIGENVTPVRGYDKRTTNQPSLKERMLVYLKNIEDSYGGLVIQQNVEDANLEVWDRIYSDPDFDEFIKNGFLGFEIKGGQGAKPGLGGEIRVDRETALKLKTGRSAFYFSEDPETTEHEFYDRHSMPGTFTENILFEQIRGAITKYRTQLEKKVRIWFKTAGYRDIDKVMEVVASAGADAITIDGNEGGTGMSPNIVMNEVGLPTICCLKAISDFKDRQISKIVSGGLYDASHLVKALCLGANGIAMGRPFIIASEGRFGPIDKPIKELDDKPQGIVNFVEALKTETQMLTSALGKYSLEQLSKEDIGALNREIAEMFGIRYIYEK